MASLMMLLRRFRSDHGAELIEMALVTPLLLMLLGAIFDFGFVFRNWEVVTNAAREGARVGILPDYSCAEDGVVEQRVVDYMEGAGFPDSSAYDVEIGPTTTDSGFNACIVKVSMFQPLASLGIIGQFFGGNFTSVPLVAASVMRTEVQGP